VDQKKRLVQVVVPAKNNHHTCGR